MPEIGTLGLMSGGGKRSAGHRPQATAPILDSTTFTGRPLTKLWGMLDRKQTLRASIENANVNANWRSSLQRKCLMSLVGAGRFELPTPCSRIEGSS